jgi:hypothetical protein
MDRLVTAALLLRRWGQEKIVLAAGVAAITAADLSHAATITIKQLGSGMPPGVLVNGDIVDGDADRFRHISSNLGRRVAADPLWRPGECETDNPPTLIVYWNKL